MDRDTISLSTFQEIARNVLDYELDMSSTPTSREVCEDTNLYLFEVKRILTKLRLMDLLGPVLGPAQTKLLKAIEGEEYSDYKEFAKKIGVRFPAIRPMLLVLNERKIVRRNIKSPIKYELNPNYVEERMKTKIDDIYYLRLPFHVKGQFWFNN